MPTLRVTKSIPNYFEGGGDPKDPNSLIWKSTEYELQKRVFEYLSKSDIPIIIFPIEIREYPYDSDLGRRFEYSIRIEYGNEYIKNFPSAIDRLKEKMEIERLMNSIGSVSINLEDYNKPIESKKVTTKTIKRAFDFSELN
jgi:hypothetical protein